MIKVKKNLLRTDFGYVLEAPCANNIICGFSTREFNYDFRAGSCKRDYQEISRKRENFFESLSLNLQNSVFLEQVHEAQVKRIYKADRGMGAYDYKSSLAKADAAITSLKDTPLCLLSADCFPLIFWYAREDIIGIAHAGWRGLRAGIAFKTAQKINRIYKCEPGKIRVFIGPGLRSCCYEVSSNFKQYFPNHTLSYKGRFYLDLLKITFSQLSEAGILKKNIIDSALCTKCNNSDFFSFRGQDKKQRMISFVSLK
ncbi:MAG: polyphenol oxidase family protein [Candidatus Omnitrophica bacterium]|nr:polyphenol oxidase family protein [Candidatus Omnitrophota bacterium]